MQTSPERRGAVLALVLLALLSVQAHPPRFPAPPPAPPQTLLRVPGDPRLDLNRAGPAELDTLPGIGPVLAQRILAHREMHGGFESIEELRAVRGIGARLFARIQGSVTVGPRVARDRPPADTAGAWPSGRFRPAHRVRP